MTRLAVSTPASATATERSAALARGRRLEYLTISWNNLEAVIALVAGMLAGSVALVGFGLDSVIETLSAVVLLWRFRSNGERRERVARRLVGIGFLLLAVYVGVESGRA